VRLVLEPTEHRQAPPGISKSIAPIVATLTLPGTLGRGGQILAPPSTYSVCPVTYDASSLHRKAAAAAMSSG
jgi:hypothetical protein